MCGVQLNVKPINPVALGLQVPMVNLTLPDIAVVDRSQPFTGDYTYTPTQETQIIPINGKKAIQDITINPSPQTYGLITWDGSHLTVS